MVEQQNPDVLTAQLQGLLDEHKHERVAVVGTTCTGKTTFLQKITGAADMDALIFPLLTPQETAYVNQTPWAPLIGQTMTRLTKERVHIQPGTPVFGTVVLDCDHVVYLHISDELLRERTQQRKVNFEDAKHMQTQIEEEINASKIPFTQFSVG